VQEQLGRLAASLDAAKAGIAEGFSSVSASVPGPMLTTTLEAVAQEVCSGMHASKARSDAMSHGSQPAHTHTCAHDKHTCAKHQGARTATRIQRLLRSAAQQYPNLDPVEFGARVKASLDGLLADTADLTSACRWLPAVCVCGVSWQPACCCVRMALRHMCAWHGACKSQSPCRCSRAAAAAAAAAQAAAFSTVASYEQARELGQKLPGVVQPVTEALQAASSELSTLASDKPAVLAQLQEVRGFLCLRGWGRAGCQRPACERAPLGGRCAQL
jgi:hypothetical protein